MKTPYLFITIGNQVKMQNMGPLHTLKALAPLIEALAPLIEALAPNDIDHYQYVGKKAKYEALAHIRGPCTSCCGPCTKMKLKHQYYGIKNMI